MKDLVVLVADKDMKMTLDGLLKRNRSLGIRPIDVGIYAEPGHDPACARAGVKFLDNFYGQFRHALLIFDYEGCGLEHKHSPSELATQIDQCFLESRWGADAKTLVLDPELETWMWSDSPKVSEAIRWKGNRKSLSDWLTRGGFLAEGQIKPPRPKEAFEAALAAVRQPRSASIYGRLAATVGFSRCSDSSFSRFRQILREWFPIED